MEQELKDAQAKIAALEAQIATSTATLEEKEGRISKLEEVLAQQSTNFKKLRDMSQEEKEMFTEKEMELMKRQEAHEEQLAKFQQEQLDFKVKQREGTIEKLVTQYAKGDKELADKIRVNLNSLKGADEVFVEEELAPLTQKAFNMLGDERPDPLRTAHNAGGDFGEVKAGGFVDTQAGKDLASALGIVVEAPKS